MVMKKMKKTWKTYNAAMENFSFHQALENVWEVIADCDRTISDKKPWVLVKEDKNTEVNDLLHHWAEALRHIAIMIWPVMPETAEKIILQLGLKVEKELAKPLAELQQWVELTVGSKIDKGEPLFPRIETNKLK
jgi:methionyl-tRNA synthetase